MFLVLIRRHLVLNKDVQDVKVKSKKQDKIRYQYDEHYFLTDPDEFIQEFWAQDPEWQVRIVRDRCIWLVGIIFGSAS